MCPGTSPGNGEDHLLTAVPPSPAVPVVKDSGFHPGPVAAASSQAESRARTCGTLCAVTARPHRAGAAVAAGLALALSACGSPPPKSAAPGAAQERAALAGSPAPLRAVHLQANQLLSGGTAAFRARLRALRGYPVVINKWAQWCAPCRSEFPVYQRVGVALGRRVAFLGLDGKDFPGPAAAFLRQFPVSYPSYQDHDEAIARSLEATTFYPETIFLDRAGRQVYLHAGPYASQAALTRDIRFYVLR